MANNQNSPPDSQHNPTIVQLINLSCVKRDWTNSGGISHCKAEVLLDLSNNTYCCKLANEGGAILT